MNGSQAPQQLGAAKHGAEAAFSMVAGSLVYWMTMLEEPLRYILLVLSVAAVALQVALGVRAWRRGKPRSAEAHFDEAAGVDTDDDRG